jgi:hypothetical protein
MIERIKRKELVRGLRRFFQRTTLQSPRLKIKQAGFAGLWKVSFAGYGRCVRRKTHPKNEKSPTEDGLEKVERFPCLGTALLFGLGLAQADHSIALFPLTTLAEQVDTLKALENGAVLFTTADGGFETVVLGHNK